MAEEGTAVDKLVRTYVRIRDKKSELSQIFKQQEDELNQQLDTLEHALLEYCQANNVESSRTQYGTFFRQVKARYWTTNWPAMGQYVVENNLPELFEKRLNQTVVKQLLEENPQAPLPGLEVESKYAIQVRRN